MKMNKKKTTVLAVLVLLIALISTSSLAWFSAKDEVKNDFLIAGSDDANPDDIFSVDVWEENDTEDDGLTFENVLPGDELEKVAHVKNTGAYDQFIRVTVTISDATAWINAVGLDINMNDVFVGFEESKWNNISKSIDGSTDTVTYVLYYNDKLASNDDITLFEAVQIPTSLTQAQAAKFEGGFTIDVVAHAVQTENVGANAYEAFQTVGL